VILIKVFISWSGDLSKEVATRLKDWIPNVLQSTNTFISSDIAKGKPWFESISTALKNSDYGILCLTNDNIKSPWLNFEAGALFIGFSSDRVCPFLYNLQLSDIDGPLKQLQATVYKKEDVFRLISNINDLTDNKLDSGRLKNTFEKYWPDLKQSLDGINVEMVVFESKEEDQYLKIKRIEATEILWRKIPELKELGSIMHTLFYATFEEEYNLAFTNKVILHGLAKFSLVDILSKSNSISLEVRQYRPYISEKLWILYETYARFIGRNAFLFNKGIESKNITDWRKDQMLHNILNPILEEKEKECVYSAPVNAYGIVIDMLEEKIFNEISKVISVDLKAKVSF
jgi:hypothetical protein